MFFKKKTPTSWQENLSRLLLELGTELYRGVGPADGSASLSATLEFDDSQRIETIENVLVDDLPKLPTFATVEKLNTIATPLQQLPSGRRLKTVAISIEHGKVNVRPMYRAS